MGILHIQRLNRIYINAGNWFCPKYKSIIIPPSKGIFSHIKQQVQLTPDRKEASEYLQSTTPKSGIEQIL